MAELLAFPPVEAQRLEPHLPPVSPTALPSQMPFVTLTFATSMDSALSLGPGIRTALSGPQSKAMTHYLRSRHDAICVGVGTAVADDPGLNCRLAAASQPAATLSDDGAAHVGPLLGQSPASNEQTRVDEANAAITARQPRPIVIDPMLRWNFTSTSKVIQLARAGKGLAPYIITSMPEPPMDRKELLEGLGGKFIVLNQPNKSDGNREPDGQRFDWRTILAAVRDEGLQSIMIEGGGQVVNSLLTHENAGLLDSVIVTIAPTWLGQGSVFVSPPRNASPDGQPTPATRLTDTMWMPLGEDVVLCGKIARRD